jgi:hypothetical protein
MKTSSILKIASALIFFIVISVTAEAQLGKIYGHVDGKDGDKAVGATVQLQRDGAPMGGVITQADGKFEFARLEPGRYTIKITDENTKTSYRTINLSPGESRLALIDMALAYEDGEGGSSPWSTDVDGIVVYGGETTELFTVDPLNPYVITGDEINKRPLDRGSIADIAAVAPRMVQPDQGDPLNMSGSRSSGTVTFVNGVKIRGSSQMPIAGISQVNVINGGVPAEYGDMTGGIIVVTTKNPGMRGYFGPANPNKVRKEVRKKYKRLEKEGDGTFLDDDERFLQLNNI